MSMTTIITMIIISNSLLSSYGQWSGGEVSNFVSRKRGQRKAEGQWGGVVSLLSTTHTKNMGERGGRQNVCPMEEGL